MPLPQVVRPMKPTMQSLGKHAKGVCGSGCVVSRARAMLRLALPVLVAVVSALWLIFGLAKAVSAQRVQDFADVSRTERGVEYRPAWARDLPGQLSAASTGTVIVNLNPSSSSVVKDQIFTVDIQVVAGAQQVDAAEIHLFFSQTYLEVLDSDSGASGVQIEDLSGWNALLTNQVYTDTEPGRILFAIGILGSGTKPNGTFPLARIHFKALQSTGGVSTPLVFGTVPPEQTQIYYGVTSVLGVVENGSVTISGQTPTVTPTPLERKVFLPIVIRQR